MAARERINPKATNHKNGKRESGLKKKEKKKVPDANSPQEIYTYNYTIGMISQTKSLRCPAHVQMEAPGLVTPMDSYSFSAHNMGHLFTEQNKQCPFKKKAPAKFNSISV